METTRVIEGNGSKAMEPVTALKHEAKINKVFDDVCHVFAARQRARQQVTIGSLVYMMKRNGFNYDKEALLPVLARLGALGLGTLQYDAKGRLKALKGIRVTLQSIGAAAVSKGTLKPFKPQARFTKLVANKVPQVVTENKPKAISAKSIVCKVKVSVDIGDKTIVFDLPYGVPESKLGEFIANISNKSLK